MIDQLPDIKVRQVLIDARAKLRSENPKLLAFYGFSLVLVLVYMLMMVVASARLKLNYFYPNIQLLVVAGAIIMFIAHFITIRGFWTKKQFFIQTFNAIALIGFLISCGLAVAFILISTDQSICGYYVGHSGMVDGIYIVTRLKDSSSFPGCSKIDQISSQEFIPVLQNACLNVINEYCNEYNNKYTQPVTCEYISTLVVGKWSSLFGLEIVAASIGTFAMCFMQMALNRLVSRFHLAKQQISEALLFQP